MNQIGKVISSDYDQALVQVIRQSACGGNCGSCGTSCSSGILLSVSNSIDAKQGELVIIESETPQILKGAALFYIFPLLVVTFGIFITKYFIGEKTTRISSDIIALSIAIVLYGICLYFIHHVSKENSIKYTISRSKY